MFTQAPIKYSSYVSYYIQFQLHALVLVAWFLAPLHKVPTDENRMATGRNLGLGKPLYILWFLVILHFCPDPEVSIPPFTSDKERWAEDDVIRNTITYILF